MMYKYSTPSTPGIPGTLFFHVFMLSAGAVAVTPIGLIKLHGDVGNI